METKFEAFMTMNVLKLKLRRRKFWLGRIKTSLAVICMVITMDKLIEMNVFHTKDVIILFKRKTCFAVLSHAWTFDNKKGL